MKACLEIPPLWSLSSLYVRPNSTLKAARVVLELVPPLLTGSNTLMSYTALEYTSVNSTAYIRWMEGALQTSNQPGHCYKNRVQSSSSGSKVWVYNLFLESHKSLQWCLTFNLLKSPILVLTLCPFSPGRPGRPSKPRSPWEKKAVVTSGTLNLRIQHTLNPRQLFKCGLRTWKIWCVHFTLPPASPGSPRAPSAPLRPWRTRKHHVSLHGNHIRKIFNYLGNKHRERSYLFF